MGQEEVGGREGILFLEVSSPSSASVPWGKWLHPCGPQFLYM